MSIAFATRPEVNALASLSCWRRELACILALNAENQVRLAQGNLVPAVNYLERS